MAERGRAVLRDGAVMHSATAPVRAWYRLVTAADWTTLRTLVHPDMEFVVAAGFPGGDRYIGPDAIFGQFFPTLSELWNGVTAEVDEFFAADGDRAAVRGRYVGPAPASQTRIEIPFVHLWRATGGRLTWMQEYADTALLAEAIIRQPAAAPEPRRSGVRSRSGW